MVAIGKHNTVIHAERLKPFWAETVINGGRLGDSTLHLCSLCSVHAKLIGRILLYNFYPCITQLKGTDLQKQV